MTMAAELDTDLITSLKLAKAKEMFFAFIPKGSEGKLIVSRKRIPPKEIAEAKKEIGGGKPVLGKCIGPLGSMVFKVAKASATLGPAIKKAAKKASGLTVVPDVQLSGEVEEAEEGAEAPEAAVAEAEGEEAPADETMTPEELAAWRNARQNAIKELRALATKVAGTKHASAAGVLKEINTIINKLPEKPKRNEIPRLKTLIREDDTITAAEESPGHFHDLKIREPLLSSLEALQT
jgi:hypothetical protein